MKSRIALVMVCAAILSAGTIYTGKAAASSSTEYKSQGRIVFDNNTADTADDVVFDASDFWLIDDMVATGKNQIGEELNKYPSVNLDLSVIPDFTELAEAIDTLTDDATAEDKMILKDYTAYVKGDKITGGMENNGATTLNAGSVTKDATYTYFSIPVEGYYNMDSKIMASNSDIYTDIYDAFVNAGTTPNDKTLDSLTEAIDKVKNDAYTQGMNAANNANIGSITQVKNGGSISNGWVCNSKLAIVTVNAHANCGNFEAGDNIINNDGRAYLTVDVDGRTAASTSVWIYKDNSHDDLSMSGKSFSMTKGQRLWASSSVSNSDGLWSSMDSFSATVWLLD